MQEQPPTREEFEEFKQEIRQEVRQLREQQTEEIKITVDRPSKEVLKRLDALEEGQQEISRKQDEHFESISKRQDEYDKGLFMHSQSISALQGEMKGARADILKIGESQADLRDKVVEIKETMATQSDISTLKIAQDEQHAMLRQILQLLGQKPSE